MIITDRKKYIIIDISYKVYFYVSKETDRPKKSFNGKPNILRSPLMKSDLTLPESGKKS